MFYNNTTFCMKKELCVQKEWLDSFLIPINPVLYVYRTQATDLILQNESRPPVDE